MTRTVHLQKGLHWLGVLDSDLKVFDIIMETTYGTTYNSYYVKTTAGGVLVETVKEKFFDSYLKELKKVTENDLASIKYLISNHTEPDHAGSIKKLLEALPDIQVIASHTALLYLKDITNIQFNGLAAEDLGVFTVGDKTFEFISAPMLHWPDSMYTYMRNEQVLFTCDSFGSHYSPKKNIRISKLGPDEEAGYQDALLYYYTAIFGPFKSYVLKGIEKISKLKIKLICNGHGPVLDARIDEIVGRYKEWSTVPPPSGPKKIFIAYCSAYGYTEEIAEAIIKGIREVNPDIVIQAHNVHIQNFGQLKPDLLAEIAAADGVLLGTNTINGDALPFIWDLALSMNPIVHGGKVVSAFGSFGWSGEGVDNIMDRLKQIRMKVIEGLKIKFRPSKSEIELAKEYGKKFANGVLTGNVPPLPGPKKSTIDYQALNPTGKVVLWRCTICGEIVAGVVPPEVCSACGVGQEFFELYTPDEITFSSPTEETFVIIGTCAAGVSAAEAIRARASKANIILIGKEDILPYYRPSLSDTLYKAIDDKEFYLHPQKWYQDNRIVLKLSSEVTAVSTSKRTVTLKSGEVISYNKLIFANGSSPFVPNFPGHNLNGVFTMKVKADADRICEYAKGKQNAVIIGGGVLGLEAADALRELGLNVTVLEFVKRIMPRQLETGPSEFLQDLISHSGVQLLTGVGTKEIRGENGAVKTVVVLPDTETPANTEIPADLVVLSLGVRANIQLAEPAGVKCKIGIIVNEKMETNVPGVYAAGDVAQFENLCIQLWSPALEQGRVAGINAVGDSATFKRKVEPLSLIAFGTELFAAGEPPIDASGLHTFTDKNEKAGQYLRLVFKEDRLIYGVAFKNSEKFSVILNGVREGHPSASVLSQIY